MAGIDPVSNIVDAVSNIGGKLIDRLWPDPAQAQAAKIELAKMAENGELARMANETDLAKSYLADTQSARDREAKLATSADAPKLNKLITPLLAIGIIVLTFSLCTLMIFLADGELKPAQERVIFFVVGALVPICSQVVSYYFGSSRGDAANAQHLRDLIGKNGS